MPGKAKIGNKVYSVPEVKPHPKPKLAYYYHKNGQGECFYGYTRSDILSLFSELDIYAGVLGFLLDWQHSLSHGGVKSSVPFEHLKVGTTAQQRGGRKSAQHEVFRLMLPAV